MAQSNQLSPVDAAWLHMEHPTNLMMITGLMLFKEPVDFERVREAYRLRLLPFRRFRQRVVEPVAGVGMPFWEDDPTFNLDAHVHHIALPAPGDAAQLAQTISDLSSTPLDFTKPLWQVHVVDNVMIDSARGNAIIMRIHHCIGDGTALVAVTQELFDMTPDADPAPRPRAPRGARRGLLNQLGSGASSLLKETQSALGLVWQEGIASILHPSALIQLVEEAALVGQDVSRRAARSASVVGRALTKGNDPRTVFKGRLGVQKRVAWSEPLSVEETKSAAHALNAKINDVLVAAMTGALRSYLLLRGSDSGGADIHAIIPVDMRSAERALDLGNVFGLVFLGMPVGIVDPIDRLKAVKTRMDSLKQSNEALLYYGLLNIFGMTPRQIEESVVDFFGAKATAVFTNVVGPREHLYLGGKPVQDVMFWVPQSGRLGMGISIYSYNGRIRLGVITDAGLVPDPERITDAFNEEFRLLARAARERAAAAATHARVRCAALTRNGSPCRNPALDGASFCKIHSHSLVAAPIPGA